MPPDTAAALEFWRSPEPSHAHWPGSPGWADHGAAVRGMVDEMGAFPSVVEWGSGGGAIAHQFRDVRVYYGVDISPASLAQAVQAAGPNFCPVLADIDAPEAVDVPPCSLLLCVTVIQHMPNRAYAERAIRSMLSRVEPGGRALVQTRSRQSILGAYAHHWVQRVAFQPCEFRELAESCGTRILWSRDAHPDYTYHALAVD